mmetsp:Transcript_37811/g.57552  ORF Transcript_37811/g.57552 Transcript_37811/m.57552 type:complete len:167 (-) Transcript_37811:150-650(-)
MCHVKRSKNKPLLVSEDPTGSIDTTFWAESGTKNYEKPKSMQEYYKALAPCSLEKSTNIQDGSNDVKPTKSNSPLDLSCSPQHKDNLANARYNNKGQTYNHNSSGSMTHRHSCRKEGLEQMTTRHKSVSLPIGDKESSLQEADMYTIPNQLPESRNDKNAKAPPNK